MTKQEIIEKVNAFLIERLEFEPSAITPDAELRRDMGMTSLDAMRIYIFVKNEFGVLPVEDDLKALITLDDLYQYIEKTKGYESELLVSVCQGDSKELE